MKKYDVIVIGAGDAGLAIAFSAASEGLKVALVEKGNVGGTCINSGCVPSKTLIAAADRVIEIREAARLGISADIREIDFRAVMERMRSAVAGGRNAVADAITETPNIDFVNAECHFIDDHTIDAGGEKRRGKKIFIATGARPSVPPIKGLDAIPYLTNESVLKLDKRPESLIIIGGGYVGLEYAHFFSAFGTKVTVIDRNHVLLPFEEPEISEVLQKELARRVDLRLGAETEEVIRNSGGYTVRLKKDSAGEISAEAVMAAAGRRSNTDLLRTENAAIGTDAAGFIKVDDFLGTSKKHVWAIGDAIGRAMFTHAADKEAELAWHNATQRKKIAMDFGSVPHAVYTWPQIASVGLTEAQAAKGHDLLVGRAKYSDTVMGAAIGEQEGLAKAVVDKATRRILGFHIIGPHAAMLIQEVVNAVIRKEEVKSVAGCMHIFPALSNLITETLGNLK
ncbi:MAG: dihydrolipoyl dehydrogenase [Nitrospiraceae bacterium]|nr:dihydrolipoyl dehydrogenase [Nitrospiraceae bacterium]